MLFRSEPTFARGALDERTRSDIDSFYSGVLGWQALGGVEYRASDQASIFAEYRYQNAHDVNAGGLTQIGNTSNILSFGVKWHL